METDMSYSQMSNEQLAQLYELMHASKGVWKPHEPEVEESSFNVKENN
jgi:hypothetical protein